MSRRSIPTIASHILPSRPIITVDIPLTIAEQTLLACLPKYITPLQSRFSDKPIDTLVGKEFELIRARTSDCLSTHCMSASDQRAKDFFSESRAALHRLHSAPVSAKSLARAKRENRLVLSIQRKLKNANAIIRRTDKSKVFYICHKDEFDQKALNYMTKTRAYEEIVTGINPYADILSSVLSLLNHLKDKKAITLEQWKLMMPDRAKCELPHLYFIPKAHKVNFESRDSSNIIFLFLTSLMCHYDRSCPINGLLCCVFPTFSTSFCRVSI